MKNTVAALCVLVVATFATATAEWSQHPGKYLGGYSAGVYKYDTLQQAQAQCVERSDCGGITYETKGSKKYTLRKGANLNNSPSEEISWKKHNHVPGWGMNTGKYLGGYSGGTYKYDTLGQAITECFGRSDCGGITYETNGSKKYTLRKGSSLLNSPSAEISWKLVQVNGGWGGYGEWSECSEECAGGIQTRSRSCDSPAPAYGGADCYGDSSETRICNEQPCPDYTMKIICDDVMTLYVDGEQKDVEGQGAWNQMSTLTIRPNTMVLAVKCTNGGGPYGIMGAVQDEAGNDVLVTDNSWSCSNSGDDGWEKADFVEGDNWKSASYYEHPGYKQNTNGNPWASMSPNRKIIWTNTAADTTVYCRKALIVQVNGGWGGYGEWSECSEECAGGIQTRSRSCDSPAPAYGGTDCYGDSSETRICNEQPCAPEWSQHPGKYLGGYSAGVYKYDTLQQAQAQCVERSDCGGITYETKGSKKYTLRKGANLNNSPSEEISWKKHDNILGWGMNTGKYLSGYSGGTYKYDTLEQALYECIDRSDCGGITYETNGSKKYTLRKGSSLLISPSAEISWKIGDTE